MAFRRVSSAVLVALVFSALLSFASPAPVGAAPAVTAPVRKWIKDVGGAITESSPVVANLDGQNSIIVGGLDGRIHAVHSSDGNYVSGWPRETGDPINSSPAAADTNGDGSTEVFVGSGWGATIRGNFWSFDNHGNVRWKFAPRDNDYPSLSMFSSPAIGDTNGDGTADVSAFALGLLGWSFTEGGTMNNGWPFIQDDTVHSSPALFDVNRDGVLDYVVGGDSAAGGAVDVRGGVLRAISGSGGLLWQVPFDDIIRSSPTVGDIDGDGEPEIVVGVGDYYYRQPGGAQDSTKIYVFNRDGSQKWVRNLGGFTMAAPALADINGDGKLDIIEPTWGGPEGGKVFALDGGGNILPGWNGKLAGGGGALGQVATADFNNDGAQDVLVTSGSGAWAINGPDGSDLFHINAGAADYQNTSWIGDIDNNGRLDIILAGKTPGANGTGIIERYEFSSTTPRLNSKNWSQFRGDSRHTGSWVEHANWRQDFCAGVANDGYYMLASDGGVFGYCNAAFHGSMGGQQLSAPIAGMAAKSDGSGYWLTGADGAIYCFGNVQCHGGANSQPLASPIVGMTPTPNGGGYWMVARDGGVFAFGNAAFHGSMGGKPLSKPIVGIASTADGGGYWLVASDGGIFSFGNAEYSGSMGGKPLNAPIVGMTSTVNGGGYWMVASDGGIFSFGNAAFHGSMGGKPINAPIVGMNRHPNGNGYRMVASDGGVFSFDVPFLGSTGGIKLNKPIIAMG